jgi:predicted 3-demethylubiquinone-9 3-methyltransferase (glyoxalase superfamily)
MSKISQRITPFLWFDKQAEEAINYYVSVFPNSKITSITRYDEAGSQASGQPVGTVMTVGFILDGQEFVAINGGPHFHFSCAVSFVVNCENQEEVDYYWGKLSAGGDPSSQQCGWLADKFGLSWQVVPTIIPKYMTSSDPQVPLRTMQAVLGMKKIDIATVEKAVTAN